MKKIIQSDLFKRSQRKLNVGLEKKFSMEAQGD